MRKARDQLKLCHKGFEALPAPLGQQLVDHDLMRTDTAAAAA
jgi:hypothetical protein